MRNNTRIKTHRDQGLIRDIGFLLVAVGFVLINAFDKPLTEAALYAPMIVGGAFAVLVGSAYTLLICLRLLELLGDRLGMSRSPRR